MTNTAPIDVAGLAERLTEFGGLTYESGIFSDKTVCDEAATALQSLSAELDAMQRRAEAAENDWQAAEAALAEAREALAWYAEQTEGCRKTGSVGDPARHALNNDGGKRARRILNGETGEKT
jgi:outer membrane murein-binding lipoprotein Lpp